MWIITDFGFFAVSLDAGGQMLTVRGRVKEDIEALAARSYELTEYSPKIIFAQDEDYRWRIQIPARIFASIMAYYISFDLVYTDFAAHIDHVQPERRTIYQDVAIALDQLDQVDLRRKIKRSDK